MYKRDVAVVILSFFALFLCLQHEGNFSFRKAWYAAALNSTAAVGWAGQFTHHMHSLWSSGIM
jgi:hypothetical protein